MSQHTVTVANNAIDLDDQPDRQVDIRITAEKVKEQAGPETVARLVVQRQDGEQAIFFVSVRLTHAGRPCVELIAKKPEGAEVKKSVQGYWKAPRKS
jgi:hypothetical protein